MNRSIMIVICDFLVLCALSLSSGLSELPDTATPEIPGYRDGYAVVPGSKAVASSDYEKLKSQAAGMQKEIERLKANAATERVSFSQAEKARQAQLSEAEKRVGLMASKLFTTEKELKEAANALLAARKETAEKNKELSASVQRVEDLKTALNVSRSMAGNQEKEILWQRKQLEQIQSRQNVTEKQLDDTRRLTREKELALTKADGKISSLNRDLQRVSQELRQSQANAFAANKRATELQGRLIRQTAENTGLQRMLGYTRKQLEDAENKLVSRSLEKYSSSVVKLSFTVSNIRPVLGDNIFTRDLYLPEIRLGNSIWLPAALLPVTGLDRNFSGYTQVNDLQYLVSLPSGNGKKEKLERNFIVPQNIPGLCLIPVKGMSKSPLPVLTWENLKKRGLRNLTLFKVGQFGTASAELAERCSIDITGKDRSLFIRNSNRHGSELLAEPGDFIITKEGEFVGTVIGLANTGNGRSQARCFVFSSAMPVSGQLLPITRKRNEKFYTDFSVQAEALRSQLKKADPVYNK